MTKLVKVSDLIGPSLDWAVAKCEVMAWEAYDAALNAEKPTPPRPSEYLRDFDYGPHFTPSTKWKQGWPIVEREGISTYQVGNHVWKADIAGTFNSGPTPLIAAMRCHAASKLGEEIEIPEELL